MATHLTEALGRRIAGARYENLPPEAVEKICFAIADTIGVMIAGRQDPAPTLLHKMLAPMGGEATVVFDGGSGRALDAAWINGTAAHALDYDDVAQQGGHASAALVPAILAEAEAIGASGKEIVLAYAVGYEIFSELASRDLDQHHDKGWHPTGIFGAIGAAAACAALRRLDAEKATMTIALGASQSCGLMSNFGTMTKPFHAGRAAHAGAASARLAELGFTAAADAIEHSPGFLEAVSPQGRVDLDTPVSERAEWAIAGRNRLAVKKYPLCYCTHRAIDGALRLHKETAMNAADIDWVKVSLSPRNASILRNHAPRTGLEAKFSIEFAVASALALGRAGLAELQDDIVCRSDIQALMRRVSVLKDDRNDPDRPGYAIYDRVEVGMRNGAIHDSGPITKVSGDPDLPLGREQLWTKFRDCLQTGSPSINADCFFAVLMSLHEVSALREVMGFMRCEPGRANA